MKEMPISVYRRGARLIYHGGVYNLGLGLMEYTKDS